MISLRWFGGGEFGPDVGPQIATSDCAAGFFVKHSCKSPIETGLCGQGFTQISDRRLAAAGISLLLGARETVEVLAQGFHTQILPMGKHWVNTYGLFTCR